MNIKGIRYAGIKTNQFEQTVDFFEGILGLTKDHNEDGFVTLKASNGDKVEVYGPNDPHKPNHDRFTTGPVVGFEVEGIEEAAEELHQSDLEVFGEVQGSKDGTRWLHFEGADGNVYELTEVKDA